ncbi:catalase family protein [Xylophilus sp.]|uniref:catalase family protein n=1 Tax=Xylophilus sp. TaxID=2653893 RepID=UPI0013BAD9F9|nr:catalase family protein [Xylophilus sp.]KAF1042925.1 MAG: hypothetical protein GAK38_04142 [Xylophilus sp.]
MTDDLRRTTPPAIVPLPYGSAYETPEDGEAETIAECIDTLRGIAARVHADEGHAYRSVHAKSHGLLRAELEVLDGLPEPWAQGVFAHGGRRHPVVMRFSTTPGDLLSDRVSTPRGLALKLLGVDGERLPAEGPGAEGARTQDFILVNGPVFNAPNARKFLSSLKLLAATTDRVPRLKTALSAALRGAEKVVEAAGGESATLQALGGHPMTDILGETFFSQVPLLWGRYMAKLSVAPVSAGLRALTGAPVENSPDHPFALREAVVRHFAAQGGEWELRAQLCTDIEAMPIEDATVLWPVERSPWVSVGRIVAAPQTGWSEARSAAVDDGMAFNSWTGLAAHRPLGSIMRVRRAVYPASAAFRSQRNGQPVREPGGIDAVDWD